MRSILATLVVVAITALLVSGCSSPARMPDVKVEGVANTSFSLASTTLDVVLSVDNPNPIGITLKSLSFDVYYKEGAEWRYLSHGATAGIPIEPGHNQVTVPVTFRNTDLIGSLVSFASNREMILEIRGVAVPDLPGGLAPEIPFSRTVSITV